MANDQLSATFAALAGPTRRAILARLLTGEASVAELAEPFEMMPRAVSKHIGVLETAGLVMRGREAGKQLKIPEPARTRGLFFAAEARFVPMGLTAEADSKWRTAAFDLTRP